MKMRVHNRLPLAVAILGLLCLAGCGVEGCQCGEISLERRTAFTTGEEEIPGTKTETTSTAAETRRPAKGGTHTETTKRETEIKRPTESGWCNLTISVPPGRNGCAVCC